MKTRTAWITLLCSILLGGCDTNESSKAFRPTPEFPGKLEIILSESKGDDFRNFTYTVTPSAGLIELSREQATSKAELPVGSASTGHIDCNHSPFLPSPDGKLVAHCEGPAPGELPDSANNFIVIQDKNGGTVLRNGFWHAFRVESFAWSPDSKSIAVLVASTSISWRPLDLLGWLAGQPVPEYTYYLQFRGLDGKSGLQSPYIRVNSRYGFGLISTWTAPDSSPLAKPKI
jgi:hypothetical protein